MADGSLAEVSDLDAYLDAAPRPDADAVAVGPFTLFVSRTVWSYYARPALDHPEPITAADLQTLAAACAEQKVALAIEWLHEVHPELAGLVETAGLELSTHVLMRADATDVAAHASAAHAADGVTVRIVTPDDPALLAGRAVADASFTAGGTAPGPQGSVERDAFLAKTNPALAAHLKDRAERGLTVTAVAEDAQDGVLAVGSYQPIGDYAEILAVATLPSARHRGLAAAVVAALARHAHDEAGVRTVLLTAQDETVARVYARTGFRRVGTGHAAEAASQ